MKITYDARTDTPASALIKRVFEVDPICAAVERDSIRVLELLDSPPEPTPALMAAARRRRSRA